MPQINPWLLPDGVQESLPGESQRLETLRRNILDAYRSWGYELVTPPLLEYLDALLVGRAADLEEQTFKFTDPVSGRLLGIRADITPQVARIDAHHLKRDEPTRLCYYGRVLHTWPGGFARSRSQLQIGAELYGHAGIASDAEILALLQETLRIAGLAGFHLDFGHVQIYRALVAQAGLTAQQEHLLFDIVQRRAEPELYAQLAQWGVSGPPREMLLQLLWLHGGVETLQYARDTLRQADASVHDALDELEQLVATTHGVDFHIDLAELRGYSYHTGVLFSAYLPGHGEAIANGGRYDHIGEYFGRRRPATGFSTDLYTLAAFTVASPSSPSSAIWAPAGREAALTQAIQQLRAQGEVVIQALPGQVGNGSSMGCNRQLQWHNEQWQPVAL